MIYYVAGIPYGKDDLAHYGVLGMKWGHRKNPNYQYQSFGTKHNLKKAARLQSRIDKAQAKGRNTAKLNAKMQRAKYRAKRSAELDRREQKYAESVSTKGNIVSRLFTQVGSKPYQTMLAMQNGTYRGVSGTFDDLSKGKYTNVAKQAMSASLSYFGGRALSTIAKAAYIRKGQPGK